jgi:hypothetical protein
MIAYYIGTYLFIKKNFATASVRRLQGSVLLSISSMNWSLTEDGEKT